MTPTVSRTELNETDDIIAERGVVRMRRSRTVSDKAVGTPTSGCDGKVAYIDKPAAEQATRRRRGLVSYRCRYCRHWHVGGLLDK